MHLCSNSKEERRRKATKRMKQKSRKRRRRAGTKRTERQWQRTERKVVIFKTRQGSITGTTSPTLFIPPLHETEALTGPPDSGISVRGDVSFRPRTISHMSRLSTGGRLAAAPAWSVGSTPTILASVAYQSQMCIYLIHSSVHRSISDAQQIYTPASRRCG